MNIIDAIRDKRLFRPFLASKNGSLRSWKNWLVALRLLYGLPVKEKHSELVLQCTGRELSSFKADGVGFKEAHFTIGRRSGKTRVAATIGGFSACLEGLEENLAAGEEGIVSCCAPTKRQGLVLIKYLKAIFQTSLMLENEVIRDTLTSFTLSNGVTCEVLIGTGKSVRGFSTLTSIVDELAFFGVDESGLSQVKNDLELVRALKPSLALTDGRLICITSPYAQRGYCYRSFKKHWGNPDSKVLYWNCASRVMNPLLPESIVKEAMESDLQSAKNEYLGEFRSDISIYLPEEVVLSAVVKGRQQLMWRKGTSYKFFVDISGGRLDDSVLCIGHSASYSDKETDTIVDAIYQYKAPHSPQTVIGDMSRKIKRFCGHNVTGDNYSANFCKDEFRKNGIHYERCKAPASELYLELIPVICSGRISLLDNPVLISQLANLERRTKSGGKDKISHPPSGHDDVANSVAGLSYILNVGKKGRAGVWLDNPDLRQIHEMQNVQILSNMY